jgi:hypothetical protein
LSLTPQRGNRWEALDAAAARRLPGALSLALGLVAGAIIVALVVYVFTR